MVVEDYWVCGIGVCLKEGWLVLWFRRVILFLKFDEKIFFYMDDVLYKIMLDYWLKKYCIFFLIDSYVNT